MIFRFNGSPRTHLRRMLQGVLLASLTLTMPVWAQSAPQLNLDGVEIRQLVQIVAEYTDRNFVIDPAVRGKVSFVTKRGLTEDELYEAFLSILQVHNLEAIESGNIIKIVPTNKARAQVAPIVTDASNNDVDKTVTQVFKLQYIPVTTAITTLQPLAGQGETRIQVNQSSNSVIVTGRAQNVERLSSVIASIDQPNNEDFELVKLRFATAEDVAQTLQGLLSGGKESGLPQKVRVSADKRTNSVLVSGDKAARERMRKAIARLDLDVPKEPKKIEFRTKVIPLRYANAEEIVKVLQGVSPTLEAQANAPILGPDGKPLPEQPQKKDEKVDIQADKSTNSVIITASDDVRANLERVIWRLDQRRSQVMVEAIIAEVSTDLSNQLGFGIATTDKGKVDSGVAAVSNLSDSLNTVLAASGASISSVPNGFIMGAVSNGFGLVMDALRGDAATNILATPTLVTMNNEEARIVIGQNVPFVTGSYTSTGTGGSTPDNPFQTIQRQDVGLTLKVTPQINRDKTIKLKIEQEVSSLASSSANASDLITNKRSIVTNVMVEDSQILVLGGLIQDDFRDSVSKVPVLGDIPVVGRAFRRNQTSKSKQNLMAFIHPVILPDEKAANAYTRKKYQTLQRQQQQSQVLHRGGQQPKNQAAPLPALESMRQQGGNSVDGLHRQRPQAVHQQPRIQQPVREEECDPLFDTTCI